MRIGSIEYGLGLLGLVTLSFVISAWQSTPTPPIWPPRCCRRCPHTTTPAVFLAVSILGATGGVLDSLNFYSSGTVEEKMTEGKLWVNSTTVYMGTCRGVVSMGVLVTSAMVLGPHRILVDSDAALMFVPVFGHWAILLFALALGIGCLGAAVELTLNAGYVFAQVFGWSWGAKRRRRDAVRFTGAFTLVLLAGLALALIGLIRCGSRWHPSGSPWSSCRWSCSRSSCS